MKSGKLFESEIRNSLRHMECFWFRIQDHSSYIPFMKKNTPIRIPKTPGDFFAVYEGVPVLIEAKSSRSATSYNTDYIKEHQIEESKKIVDAGGRGYLLINNRHDSRNSMVWFMSGQEIEDLIKEKKRKSLKWSDFPEERQLYKVKAGIWDLNPLFC